MFRGEFYFPAVRSLSLLELLGIEQKPRQALLSCEHFGFRANARLQLAIAKALRPNAGIGYYDKSAARQNWVGSLRCLRKAS